MPGPTDSGERDPSHDWRSEVAWPRVRRLVRLHGLYWAFGAAQVAMYWTGVLVGVTRTLIGVVDYLAWAVLLVMSMRVVARPRHNRGSATKVSPRTFLILVGFMASLCGYILLLGLIGLGTIKLV